MSCLGSKVAQQKRMEEEDGSRQAECPLGSPIGHWRHEAGSQAKWVNNLELGEATRRKPFESWSWLAMRRGCRSLILRRSKSPWFGPSGDLNHWRRLAERATAARSLRSFASLSAIFSGPGACGLRPISWVEATASKASPQQSRPFGGWGQEDSYAPDSEDCVSERHRQDASPMGEVHHVWRWSRREGSSTNRRLISDGYSVV